MNAKRTLITVIIVAVIAVSMSTSVYATEAQEPDVAGAPEETPEQRVEREAAEMPIQSNELKGWPQGPATRGEAAIVMEVGTGAILYAKNIDVKEYPASITKVLTALVALENGKMTDKVTFSNNCVSFLQPGDSSVGLKDGNVITLEQALYATLLASANEAAYAVGESVGSNTGHDYNWFLEQMNTRCKELGGLDSNFVNTNGLHDENHVTTAKDMALIGRELFKHPEFFKIVQTSEYKIEASGTTEEHIFQQKHKMLLPNNQRHYEYAIGGKTGYTTDAQGTLITMADNGDAQLVCVVLKTYGANIYPDTTALFEYGFNNFKKVSVADNEKSEDVAKILDSDKGGYVMLPEGVSFDELDMDMSLGKGQVKEATLTYTYEGQLVGTAKAKPSKSYMNDHSAKIKKTHKNEIKNDTTTIGKVIKVVMIALVLTLAGMLYYRNLVVRKRKQRKQRKRRRKRRR